MRHIVLLCGVMFLSSEPSYAQVPGEMELPKAVVDIRPAFSRYGKPIDLAAVRGLVAQELPGKGWGIEAAGHWYPLRYRKVILGFGGSIAASTGTANSGVPATGTTRAHKVNVSYLALAPQLSLNFAGSNGWSYVSFGLGPARLSVTVDDTPNPERPPSTPRGVLNYGGGARWFITDHVAFTFDIRVYAISPQVRPGFGLLNPRMNLIVVSSGISLK